MKLWRFFVAVTAVVAMTFVSAGVMGLIHPAQAQTATTTDYDTDDDGLIEVGSLAQLDAIRYDLDGDGSSTNSSAYDAAFPNAATGLGCPSAGCTGYELTTNLDFDTNGDGRTDIVGDDYWNGGAGWEPIGTGDIFSSSDVFTATFEGNGNTISGLFINRSATDYVGLFGAVARAGVIENLGLTDVDVTGGSGVGGLAGVNGGTIVSSYAAGTVSGQDAGGLVGKNLWNELKGIIVASYAAGAVTGTGVGGLVGHHSGRIITSYAAGTVTGQNVGGLVATLEIGTLGRGTIFASYWDWTTSRESSVGGEGKTTAELQSPTGYTGIYADWNVDLDGDGTGDDPWDFGTSSEYPTLKGVGPVSPVEMDRLALVALYNATDGANWTNNTNWLSDEPLGDWRGVTTDANGHVTALDLARNNLAGTIPAELGDLSSLTVLLLYGNQLTGAIPAELGSLSNLTRLQLWGNQLTGPIPAELGSLSNLTYLSIDENQLTGAIPAELGSLSNLAHLDISGNQLSGQIPQGFTELNLTAFRFADNAGLCAPTDAAFQSWLQAIPNTDGGPNCPKLTDKQILEVLYNATDGANWMDNTNWLSDEPLGDWHGVTTDDEGRVTELSLGRNDLTGAIPSQLGNLSDLETLWLGDNQLTGAIPAELGSLSNLDYLGLEGNALTDTIPTELGSLSSLTWLALNGNQLTGALPQSFTNLTALDDFTFSDNAGLCAPTDAAFQTWLQGISNSNMTIEVAVPFGPNCASSELTDREILIALYNATDGDNWTNNTNWLSDEPLSNWHGVTTDADGRVTKLDLTGNRLSGRMPSQLGDLSSLRELRLGNNDLSGPIPSELGKLSALTRLDLENNDLSGPIPSQLEGMSDLRVLLLGDNNLDGRVPAQLGNLGKLSYLRIRNNDLTGPIPPELGRLKNLTHLFANDNDFVGSIPSELGNMSSLRYLFLNDNDLSGSIPAALGQLDKLVYLWLNQNDLTGSIPGEIGDLPNLIRLYINHNNLSGPIPAKLGALGKLERLYVHRNNLSGTIPRELAGLANLKHLYAYDNDLSGAIPIELGRLAKLERLHIADNDLGGSIPSELGELTNLSRLILSENDLTGGIPRSLGRLSNLQVLSLSNNELSGAIPAELGDLTALIQLYIGNNYLEGCIPPKLRDVPSNDLDSLGLSDC